MVASLFEELFRQESLEQIENPQYREYFDFRSYDKIMKVSDETALETIEE